MKVKNKKNAYPVTLIMYDEKRKIKSYLKNNVVELKLTNDFVRSRIKFLNKSIGNYPLILPLHEIEIKVLYEYWITKYFHQGDDMLIKQRLDYFKNLLPNSKEIFQQKLTEFQKELAAEKEDGRIDYEIQRWIDSFLDLGR